MYRLALLTAAALLVNSVAEARQATIGGGPTPSGSGAVIVGSKSVKGFGRSTIDTRIPPPLNGTIPPPFSAGPSGGAFVGVGASTIGGPRVVAPRRITSKIVITTTGATTVTITREVRRGPRGASSALICAPTIGRDVIFTGASPRSTSDAVVIVHGNERIVVSGLGARPSVAHSRAALACARGLGSGALIASAR